MSIFWYGRIDVILLKLLPQPLVSLGQALMLISISTIIIATGSSLVSDNRHLENKIWEKWIKFFSLSYCFCLLKMVGETAHNGRWRDLPKYKHLATVGGTFVASHKMRYWGNLRKSGKHGFLLDLIASPSTYPCQSVGEWVIHNFRFGDSYCISEICELVNSQTLAGPGNFSMCIFLCRCLHIVTWKVLTLAHYVTSTSTTHPPNQLNGLPGIESELKYKNILFQHIQE